MAKIVSKIKRNKKRSSKGEIRPGKKYKNLVAHYPVYDPASKNIYWRCLCTCGQWCWVETNNLRNYTRSCGNCSLAEYTGKILGTHLTGVKKLKDQTKSGGYIYACITDDFKLIQVSAANIAQMLKSWKDSGYTTMVTPQVCKSNKEQVIVDSIEYRDLEVLLELNLEDMEENKEEIWAENQKALEEYIENLKMQENFEASVEDAPKPAQAPNDLISVYESASIQKFHDEPRYVYDTAKAHESIKLEKIQTEVYESKPIEEPKEEVIEEVIEEPKEDPKPVEEPIEEPKEVIEEPKRESKHFSDLFQSDEEVMQILKEEPPINNTFESANDTLEVKTNKKTKDHYIKVEPSKEPPKSTTSIQGSKDNNYERPHIVPSSELEYEVDTEESYSEQDKPKKKYKKREKVPLSLVEQRNHCFSICSFVPVDKGYILEKHFKRLKIDEAEFCKLHGIRSLEIDSDYSGCTTAPIGRDSGNLLPIAKLLERKEYLRVGKEPYYKDLYICICKCGNFKIVTVNNLIGDNAIKTCRTYNKKAKLSQKGCKVLNTTAPYSDEYSDTFNKIRWDLEQLRDSYFIKK